MSVPALNSPKAVIACPDNRELLLSMAAECCTQKEMAEVLGVSPSTIARALALEPEFKAIYEATLFESSVQLVERLREIPFNLQDAQRARVQIEALQRYLELRWPARYGKRMELTVRHADMRGALTRARARADAARVVAVVEPGAASAGVGPVSLEPTAALAVAGRLCAEREKE